MIKFGTDGWRAVISDEFTFANVKKVAVAIAHYIHNHKLNSKPIIIGYDARFLADKFAEAIAAVMEAAGIDCFLCQRDTPTPVIAWEVKDLSACGAVVLTASHNPPQYCGIKFIPHYSGPANQEITKEIENNLSLPPIAAGKKGKLERFEPKQRYFKYIEKFFDVESIKKAKLEIVVDPMFGSGRGYLDALLESYGCKIEEIHGVRDVLFGGQNPEPEEATLSELASKVKETKSALGLALDGDADRFGVVDELGKFYSANQMFAILFEYLVAEKGYTGSVVRSVGTTHMIDAIAKLHNIKVKETPVGFKHIADIMMKEDVIIGGEESGGITIKGHIPEKDGLLANVLVVEMLAKRGKPLSRIWEELELKIGKYDCRRNKIKLEENKKSEVLEKLKNNLPKEVCGVKVAEVNTIDGVKIILADGSWFLIRPSGTEPLVRLYIESKDKADIIEKFCYNLIGGT
ncbi:MAG: Phosphoglucosamine mutase [Candidatus Saganbacteria bacterium]|uniref:Phosphoglucosamine mutase n=1 Tax=Candidatus Saganbacteria bacterium TaxID=2575572 RepID=A0A833L133_UNCSA|nr:MAG: Phosphoglucosamine mutase [Candidatus Saganbacteria bacterium]